MLSLPWHSSVLIHRDCQAELDQLIKSDEIPGFIADYEQRIGFLIQHFGYETIHRSWFEVLKKAHGLRSIRFMKYRNLRILYVIENPKAYLLLAFEERQGHKNTEYQKYIDPALRRLNDREDFK